MAFELRVDCPSCRVEGARVESWDLEFPSCRLGVPNVVRCSLCRQSAEGRVPQLANPSPGDGCPACGSALDDASRDANRCPFCGAHALLEEKMAAFTFANANELSNGLDAWAREEGLGSARDLLDAYFVLTSPADVYASMTRGERVETTFDVADYLFSGGGAGGAAAAEPAVMRVEEEAPPSTLRPPPQSIRKVGGPREELLAIASVAAADGEASADDQQILLRAAQKRGVPPLSPEDIRVWRPNEIDPPATLVDRERVIEEMFQMSVCDGQLDDSELRVIKDFARAWGIDPERVKQWMEDYSFGDRNRIERWFRRIGFFLFPGK
jgi:tellurite resistance protein